MGRYVRILGFEDCGIKNIVYRLRMKILYFLSFYGEFVWKLYRGFIFRNFVMRGFYVFFGVVTVFFSVYLICGCFFFKICLFFRWVFLGEYNE